MHASVELWKKPTWAKYMIAGWRQWADAGSISSGLPEYLIKRTQATKVGRIRPHGFYLFQIPGTHHLIRPVVKLNDGHREVLHQRKNEFFYAEDKGFLIFLGEEPHMNEDQYAEAFCDAVVDLGIERVVAVGGVYGAMPYDKDRRVSCIYSMPEMKQDLSRYAVNFSNYEGGATIATYLADKAEQKGIEFVAFYAFAPAYDFSTEEVNVQTVAIEEDHKSWYDIMRRLNHMLDLNLDLSDLEKRANRLITAWGSKLDYLENTLPQLKVSAYIEKVNEEFEEKPFEPLSNVWEKALRHLFDEDA
jgi:proteasome assembly chaperone (PAC2) family protein